MADLTGKVYTVTLEGSQPLLMHQDNIEWSDAMKKWQKAPENKGKRVSGDDRSPAWTWLGSLYHDDDVISIPNENLMTMMREGGALVPVPNAKGSKTFKSQTQSGLMVSGTHWPLFVDGKTIEWSALSGITSEEDFDEHRELVRDLGFSLFVKRARIGQSKHIRVRPMFRSWATQGQIMVLDDQITQDILEQILTLAGRMKGLCDWRPSSKTPGPYGTFIATVEEA